MIVVVVEKRKRSSSSRLKDSTTQTRTKNWLNLRRRTGMKSQEARSTKTSKESWWKRWHYYLAADAVPESTTTSRVIRSRRN